MVSYFLLFVKLWNTYKVNSHSSYSKHSLVSLLRQNCNNSIGQTLKFNGNLGQTLIIKQFNEKSCIARRKPLYNLARSKNIFLQEHLFIITPSINFQSNLAALTEVLLNLLANMFFDYFNEPSSGLLNRITVIF